MAGRLFCYRCFKAQRVCICDRVPVVPNRTFVHILQHPREQRRAIGTARLARLGLSRCAVEVVAPKRGAPSVLSSGPLANVALLYPSARARPIDTLGPGEAPRTLVILDGTWKQALGLYRANPWLDRVPHLRFGDLPRSRYRIRRQPAEHCLSTVEAVVAALRVLEPDTQGLGELLAAFDAMVETQIGFES